MSQLPISAYQETAGMIYFARMLDKIRKQARGELREDFHANLGRGFDGRCCDYLRINYAQLAERTRQGGTDEEILQWCYAHGRALNDGDREIWNQFLRKAGWNDGISETLARRKQEGGFGDRADIQTMLEYFEVDEGRKP